MDITEPIENIPGDKMHIKSIKMDKYYPDEEGFAALFVSVRLFLDDLYSAFSVCLRLVSSWEIALYLVNAATAAAFYMYYTVADGSYLSSKISFSLLSVAIIFPLTFQMNETFIRRDLALGYLADFKALICNITAGCCIWDFPNPITKESYGGRSNLPRDFYLDTRDICLAMCKELHLLLSLPVTTTGRFHVFAYHARKHRRMGEYAAEHASQVSCLTRLLMRQVEILKKHGMPSNEASRINQYVWILQARVEALFQIKQYRTPQSTRSYTRFYLCVLPWFIGPYFAWLGSRNMQDEVYETNPGFAMATAVLYETLLVGLMLQTRQLEDVFLPQGVDNVRMEEDMIDHMRLINSHVNFALEKLES